MSFILACPLFRMADKMASLLSFIRSVSLSFCPLSDPCGARGANDGSRSTAVSGAFSRRTLRAIPASVGVSSIMRSGSSYVATSWSKACASRAMSSAFMGERRPPVRAMERTLESERSSRESAARAVSEGTTAASTRPIAISSIRFFRDTDSAKAGAMRWIAFARRSAFLYMNTFRMSFSNTLLNMLVSKTKSSRLASFCLLAGASSCSCLLASPCCPISYRTVYVRTAPAQEYASNRPVRRP